MSQASSLRPHGADGHAPRSLAKSSMSGAAAWRGKSAVSLPDLDAALAVALATLPSAPPLLLWPPQDRHTDTSSSKPLSATSQTRLLHFAASHGIMPCLDRHALHASLPEQLHNSMYGVHGKVLHPDQLGSTPAPDPAAAPRPLQGLLPQPPPQPRSCSQGGHRSPGSVALRLQGASKSASGHDPSTGQALSAHCWSGVRWQTVAAKEPKGQAKTRLRA
ncbi:hypothetical protein HaLaN_18234 [Haematococcus lacustris]|uniref:Uncharacterized protein n=1 Tax=Haematococcus lacustris TaxID=44745 RepID=A0A699ZE78_HAELA|nr:hypothetical protein HaLaN_18234 [Haematococcus lacustris]